VPTRSTENWRRKSASNAAAQLSPDFCYDENADEIDGKTWRRKSASNVTAQTSPGSTTFLQCAHLLLGNSCSCFSAADLAAVML